MENSLTEYFAQINTIVYNKVTSYSLTPPEQEGKNKRGKKILKVQS